ncbi:DUF402 domain-containing protein [Photobacterium gaetbulicola]|nr:DUF402 domain-containing protein [Photobacterium gaetbulicola]PST99761.1 DUF402 domain-containing protein [Photobacterium gaetbulicola]
MCKRTWCLIPITILKEDEQFIILRISCGTEWLAPIDNSGRHVRLGETKCWRLAPRVWLNKDLTYLIPKDKWLAYGITRRIEGKNELEFYINFQRPLKKQSWGIDTLDLELDLVADVSKESAVNWRWKDVTRYVELCNTTFFSNRDRINVNRASILAKAEFEQVRNELLNYAEISAQSLDLSLLSNTTVLPDDVRKLL